jgi:hypothetical protein
MNKTMTFVAAGLFGLAAPGAQSEGGDPAQAFDAAGAPATTGSHRPTQSPPAEHAAPPAPANDGSRWRACGPTIQEN